MCRTDKSYRSNSGDSETIGGKTLIGMIPTFKENLKMSYEEVFEKIPYRVLILMQKDKQRVTSSDEMIEVTDDEFFNEE